MLSVSIESIGIAAPGLNGWKESAKVLNGTADYCPEPLQKYKPSLLPPNERRRATELVRMAFRVCEDAFTQRPDEDAAQYATVFASSGGDYPIIDQICRSLCEPERLVSPTRFHNSVHNSAAGYWSIAVGGQCASTSLSAHDASFSAGLLEAMTYCQLEQQPCLLAVYDICPPEPLQAKRNIPVEFGTALLLKPIATEQSLATIRLQGFCNNDITSLASPPLETLRQQNPAARSLTLLTCIAQQKSSTVIFENGFQNIVLEVTP